MRCLLTGAEIYAPLEDMPNLSRICQDRTVSFEESLWARFGGSRKKLYEERLKTW